MLRLDPRRLARTPRSSEHIADDDWAVERWDLMLRVRFIGIAILAVAGAIAFDWRLGPIVAVGVAGYNGAHLVHLKLLGRPARWLPISDVLACTLVIFIVPDVVLLATFVMITVVAAATAAGAALPSLAATVTGTIGLLLVDSVEAADGARSAAVGVAISGVLLVLGIGSLVDSESRLRARLTGLVEDLDAVLWTRDPSTHCITNVNGRVASLLGISAQEWMAEGFWPARIHPDDRDGVLARTLDAVAAGRDHDLTYRMVDRRGRIVHVLDRVTVIRDATGEVTELHGVTLDVSERHSIEEQSRQYADTSSTSTWPSWSPPSPGSTPSATRRPWWWSWPTRRPATSWESRPKPPRADRWPICSRPSAPERWSGACSTWPRAAGRSPSTTSRWRSGRPSGRRPCAPSGSRAGW